MARKERQTYPLPPPHIHLMAIITHRLTRPLGAVARDMKASTTMGANRSWQNAISFKFSLAETVLTLALRSAKF